ncbi:MAG TPA: DnaA/Hda family protein [Lacipirellulaceae bacterium]|nr:DnaA/Hda family protein [Lacipirellulaceae bacterium]
MEDSEVAAALSTQLAERIGQRRFDTWFRDQARLCVCGGALTVRATNLLVCEWLRTHFAKDVRECWTAIAGPGATVEFEINAEPAVASEADSQASTGPAQSAASARGVQRREVEMRVGSKAVAEPAAVRRNVSLADFVVGASNECAFRAAELTARGRQLASPLILCGPTGVGKTHLLRGILQEYRRTRVGAAVLYLTAEQFTTGFVEALRGSGLPSFRLKCRGADLLAIDDLQFFPGKRRTLEELLYTLDTLMADGRQIVVASDRRLSELRMLGPELVSRLSGGLTCEMASPEFVTRKEIARRLAAEAGIELAEEVVTLVATQITAGARELRGAIHRMRAMSVAFGETITPQLAERGLAELVRQNTRNVRLADVQKVVCDVFGVEPAQLRSERKGRSLAEPRMLAMWLARKYTRAPWSEIGEYFGRSSHSTVISAHKRVEKLIAEQAQIGVANQTCEVDDAIRQLETALRTA